jgi:SAM-dependent methyltransferase
LSPRPDLVVYTTVLAGAYEQPANTFPEDATGFERICFTDDPHLVLENWSVVLLDDVALDAGRESLRPKLLPHAVLPEFEWSLYIDHRVRLKVNPLDIQRMYAAGDEQFVSFKHPERDCIYDEAEEVIHRGMDSERRVREQVDYYRQKGYPSHDGLIDSSMLLRRHSDPAVARMSAEWFEHVLRFSKCDQLSFNYVARRNRFSHSLFPDTIRESDIVDWPADGDGRMPDGFSDEVYRRLNPDVARAGVAPREHYLRFGKAENRQFAAHRWELDELANKHRSNKGSLYFNAHAYAAVYESYLREKRLAELHIVDLGLLGHDGSAVPPDGPYDDTPSLRLWRDYFPNARIVGFDLADLSAAPALQGVQIVRGDCGEVEDLQRLVEGAGGEFDVVIDDAGHASHYQQKALSALYPHLKPGGLYFIEDVAGQPPQWEKPDAVRTREFLWRVLVGNPTPTADFNGEPFRLFCETVEFVHLHDSFDRQLGQVTPDAFAVIRRKDAT